MVPGGRAQPARRTVASPPDAAQARMENVLAILPARGYTRKVESKPTRPYAIDIKLGYTCNNNCLHCVIADQRDWARNHGRPVDRTGEEIVQELGDARRRGFSWVVLTGGEPLIRRDLPTLLKACRRLGFRVIIQTNGRMLSRQPLLDRLRPFPVILDVALLGPRAEIHDRITRTPGSHAQTLEGLTRAVGEGFRVRGKIVLSRLNYPLLDELVALYRARGILDLSIAFPHGLGNARHNFEEVVPRYSALAPLLKSVLDRHHEALNITLEAIPYCFLEGHAVLVAEGRMPAGLRFEHRQLDEHPEDWRQARREMKIKLAQCRECSYDHLCEGPWREYPEHFGDGEFKPLARLDL